jgi:hypothetical protein
MSKINDINEHFKMPIFYNDQKVLLKENIISDLELTSTVDSSNVPIYNYYFNAFNEVDISNNKPEILQNLFKQITKYYTTDVDFLKDSQTILKTYCHSKENNNDYNYDYNYNKIIKIWDEIKNDNGFKERYYYIDWPMWEFLNKSQYFLQFMSIYNLASPVISLFVPIIILIIPFFVIRLKGLHLTMSEYIEILKVVVSNHSLGRLFTQFHAVSFQEKIYLILSAAFYLFSIYQNILICMRFHQNMVKIHNYFIEIKKYLQHSICTMENYLTFSNTLKSHDEFNSCLMKNINVLKDIQLKMERISDLKYNFNKLSEIGGVLKLFYEIYDNPDYNHSIVYSFGFKGYIECIIGLQQHIKEKKINYAEFTKEIKCNTFKKNYYACLKDKKHVKNNVKLNKNLIISGPNASGKTTVIKSVLINIIVTQQFGCGFYESAVMKPYDHIHCYINIPDTSGRDSLFQAEARRCKEIIDIIQKDSKNTHFCAFDELYSGTNPDEATVSAIAFMEYIIKNKNVNTILTTHFIKVCKKLKKNKLIENYSMDTIKKKDKLEYLYQLKKGISKVKGGINVLYDMNYPTEIIENTVKSF